MKVIIVGAGITGLATALALRKYCSPLFELELVIYESYDPVAKNNLEASTFQELSSSSLLVGGGIGLSANGMHVIHELSPKLHQKVIDEGFLAENFVFKSARGWRLGSSSTSDRRGTPGFPPGQAECCVSISRHGLWNLLLDEVGRDCVTYRKVVKAQKAEGSTKARVVFSDESYDEGDLIIGADGVRSTVRRGIFAQDEISVQPHYDGLIGVGGFLDGPIPQEVATEKSMVFTFGANGFFGYSANSSESTMWWSTCQMENVPEQRKLGIEEMRAQLVARHGHWEDPIIKGIVNRAAVTQIYPIWTIDELPQWGEHGLVVVGDAAHALNPTSGQGSSQGLEDAQCLSLLLAELHDKHNAVAEDQIQQEVIELAIKGLYNIRNPRLQRIAERTRRMASSKKDQSFVVEMLTAGMFWLMINFHFLAKLMMGDVNKELNYWDMKGLIDAEVKRQVDNESVRPQG